MRYLRLQFSVRTLLIGVVVLAALLALSIRFGPHVVWKTAYRDVSSGVVPIPSRPLVATPPADHLVICSVGPVSFEFPKAMAERISVHRGLGGAILQFCDDERSLALTLPQRDDGLLQLEIEDFPDKSKLSFPRLYKEIADGQSSDFSFGMSHRELRWHQWLLTNRSKIGIDIDCMEYLWRSDLEGNLLFLSSVHTFQWATTDRQWKGTMYFKCLSLDDVDWIRHVCTTFVIKGDPNIFHNRDDACIESMITLTQLRDGGETMR